MKPLVPLSALMIYIVIVLLINNWLIPNPENIIDYIRGLDINMVLFFMFLIILLESIIYIWFYLPWQFIAVLLVITYSQNFIDIIYLTFISILAVTIWAFINYNLWKLLSKKEKTETKINYKKLLFSMIHINTIALFVFDQWIKKAPKKIIYMTWLLNIPYYFLIIWVTYILKDEIMTLSENWFIIIFLLLIWFIYSLIKNKYKLIN